MGPDDADDDDREAAGGRIVNLTWAGTAVFVATSTLATLSPGTFGLVHVVTCACLFAAGCVAFLWAFGLAVSRSRTDEIGIGGLFFLAGSAPPTVRRRLLGPLALQAVVAVVTASIRPFTAVAFGILVPIFGLGLSGLWGARHGVFGPRAVPQRGRGR